MAVKRYMGKLPNGKALKFDLKRRKLKLSFQDWFEQKVDEFIKK